VESWEDLRDLREYSQEGLLNYPIEAQYRASEEQRNRIVETKQCFARVCMLNKNSWLWYRMWESGGVRSFGEISAVARSVGVNSSRTISRYVRLYVKSELALKHMDRYRILGPRWLE
jgi:hypothetical protein